MIYNYVTMANLKKLRKASSQEEIDRYFWLKSMEKIMRYSYFLLSITAPENESAQANEMYFQIIWHIWSSYNYICCIKYMRRTSQNLWHIYDVNMTYMSIWCLYNVYISLVTTLANLNIDILGVCYNKKLSIIKTAKLTY